MTTTDDPRVGFGGHDRIHITLGPTCAPVVRVMASRMRMTVPELMTRTIGLFHLWMSLPPGKYLAVVTEDTGDIHRLQLEKGNR